MPWTNQDFKVFMHGTLYFKCLLQKNSWTSTKSYHIWKKKTHKKHFNSLCLIELNELLGSFSLFFFFFGICERFLFQQLMNHGMQGIVQVEREDWRNCWFILIRFKFQDFNFFVLRFRLKNTSTNYCTNQGVFCLTSNKGSSQFSSVLFNFLLW